MTEPLLSVEDLTVCYGEIGVLDNIRLNVSQGQVVTVIGPNGAGKTTLLSRLSGLLRGAGSIGFQGQNISRLEVEQIVAEGLVLVPEKRELFTEMSVEDNLILGSFLKARDIRKRQSESLEYVYGIFPRLRDRQKQYAGTLSGGERQMLALGRALMSRPKLLMLDEPSLGLAPLIIRDVFRVIATLRKSGVSILLVEQNARAALQIADYAYVLESGQIAFEGKPSQLAQDPRLIQAYLGSTDAYALKNLGEKHE